MCFSFVFSCQFYQEAPRPLLGLRRKIDRLSAKGTIVQPYLNMPRKKDIQNVWKKGFEGLGKSLNCFRLLKTPFHIWGCDEHSPHRLVSRGNPKLQGSFLKLSPIYKTTSLKNPAKVSQPKGKTLQVFRNKHVKACVTLPKMSHTCWCSTFPAVFGSKPK